MARDTKKGRVVGRISLDGGDDIPERPELAIHAVGDDDVLATAPVGADGDFELDEAVVAKARRIVITARDGDPSDKSTAYMIRPDALRRTLELGDLQISAVDWGRFILRRRCIDATVRHCFPRWVLLQDLVANVRELRPEALSIAPRLLHPLYRCAPVCEGTVEVYRRRCCCHRLVIDPPFELEPPFELPEPFPEIFPTGPFPPGPFPPGPGPDPAPFALQEALLTEGAIDADKVRLLHAELHPGLRPKVLFPPKLCFCGPPVKVAEGFVGEGGSVHVCWTEPLRFLPRHCHDEYAFIVRQNIAGNTVVIYNGLAAGQWFDDDDEIRLTSYHPKAVGCREDEFPVPVNGAFVVLQDIGATEAHRLRTPLPDSADSVQAPAPGSGLLDLDGGPDWACGGSLQLRYHFSEIVGASMKALGAVYYRVQRATANAAGDPVGAWDTLPVPAWDTWRVIGSDIVPGNHSLGPHSVGAENDLFFIPFETGAPLVAGEEWQDGQFHAVVPTDDKVEGRYLFRIEVFDAAGNRLEPGAAPFTYRRWNTPTTTTAVNFGALTHLLRTDNRPVVGEIIDIVGPGAGIGDCKFFEGTAAQAVSIQYRAFHPEPGSPSFMRSYSLSIHRGVSGTLATPTLASNIEVGEGGPPAGHAVTIADLLDGEDRCSFAVHLYVSARIHNGSGALTHLDRSDIAAFAVLQS